MVLLLRRPRTRILTGLRLPRSQILTVHLLHRRPRTRILTVLLLRLRNRIRTVLQLQMLIRTVLRLQMLIRTVLRLQMPIRTVLRLQMPIRTVLRLQTLIRTVRLLRLRKLVLRQKRLPTVLHHRIPMVHPQRNRSRLPLPGTSLPKPIRMLMRILGNSLLPMIPMRMPWSPSQQQSNPYAYGAPPPQNQQNPYGQQMVPSNPYGAPPAQPAFLGYGQPAYGAPPQAPAPVDPFSVFEKPEPPAPEPAVEAVSAGPDPNAPDDDFWGSFGNNNAEAAAPVAAAPKDSVVEPEEEEKKGEEGLPPGGEWYDARIFTPTLGVMFFKPQELTDSLFLNTDKEIVEGLGERPVVAFIVEGSSARSAGVELGHVLLKVNGVDVRSPKEASRLIKEGPRPLPLLFYVPSTEVVIAEGEHMVKYDTKETVAPNSAKDWKPKYVVIGGIIAQPWMMNMYRSKVRFVCAFLALRVWSH